MKIPLVLIPGLLSNATLWQHQVTHLSDIASCQIASPIENTPEKLVQSILKMAPSRFALAGHSMGGWLCLEIMKIAPFRVSKLCLINTTSRDDSQEKRQKRNELISKAKEGHIKEIAKEITNRFVFQNSVKTEAEKMFLAVGKETFIHQQEAMLQRKECKTVLSQIECPTLVIHATQDKNFSLEEHEELRMNISNAKLALLEDCGHMSPMEMPQAVTTLLRFWLNYF